MRALLVVLLCAGIARAEEPEYPPRPVQPPGLPPQAPEPPPPPHHHYRPQAPPGADRYLAREPGWWDREAMRKGSQLKVAGAIMISVGTAALITGIVLNVLSVDCNDNQATGSTDCNIKHEGMFIGGLVSSIGGAGLLAGGIAAYVIGSQKVDSARHVGWSLAPLITPRETGAQLRLSF
jgi:hypothetical protein